MRPGAAIVLLLAPLAFAQFQTASVNPASGETYVHPTVEPQRFRIEVPLFDIVEWPTASRATR